MTELQVKTKKGSLKKFFAMFLAVCVCLTTFQLNGVFAAGEDEGQTESSVSPDTAEFERNVSGDKAYKVESGTNLNTADYLVVSPDNAAARATITWAVEDVSPSNAVDVSDSGVVTGEVGGTATVKISVGGTEISDSCTVKIIESTVTPTPTPKPTVKPTTPAVKPTTPAVKPTTPAVKPTTPAPKPTTPAVKPVKVKKVTLSASKLYLVANKSVTVGVGIEPSNAKNKAVTWKSKSTKVATVKNGKITAKKNAAGKNTTITATAKDGSKKSASVKVYVVKRATKITKVTLPKTAKVDVKGTVALKTTLKPAKATVDSKTLKWSTSDRKVATVKNGVVTGKKAGVATITVKAGKKSAKCVVTVTKKGVKATLQKTKATVKVKRTYQIKLKGKGDSIVDCKTSNKKVATVSKKGKITGKKKGTATITVITKKGGVATFKVTVKK